MKKELFKFGVNNTKLKNTITFSKSSGLTCPAANKCKAFAHMNAQGKRSVKRFKGTEFTCYSATLEALYPSLYNLTRHNTSLLNEYIKNDDFNGLVECFNVSLNKKRSKNINLDRGYFKRFSKVVFSTNEAKILNLPIDTDDSHAYESKGANGFALLLHGTQEKNTRASEALREIRKNKKLVTV